MSKICEHASAAAEVTTFIDYQTITEQPLNVI